MLVFKFNYKFKTLIRFFKNTKGPCGTLYETLYSQVFEYQVRPTRFYLIEILNLTVTKNGR